MDLQDLKDLKEKQEIVVTEEILDQLDLKDQKGQWEIR